MNARYLLFCLLLVLITRDAGAAQEIGGGLQVEVIEIKRTQGDTVTLRFKVTNPAKATVRLQAAFVRADLSEVHLLDWVGKKRLSVVRALRQGQSPECLCSREVSNNWSLGPGGSRDLWAKFPAPPAAVSKVSVEFPGAIPIEDVPIAK